MLPCVDRADGTARSRSPSFHTEAHRLTKIAAGVCTLISLVLSNIHLVRRNRNIRRFVELQPECIFCKQQDHLPTQLVANPRRLDAAARRRRNLRRFRSPRKICRRSPRLRFRTQRRPKMNGFVRCGGSTKYTLCCSMIIIMMLIYS